MDDDRGKLMDDSEEALTSIRRGLEQAQGQLRHTRAVEQALAQAAETRLQEVEQEMQRIAGDTAASMDEADRYQTLALESGRLREILARSREAAD